jgi:hypothetical protein
MKSMGIVFSTNAIFLTSNMDDLEVEPTKVEKLLLHKGLLYVGVDRKLYFTPKALTYFVENCVYGV